MSDKFTIKVRRFLTNPLLQRKQFAVDVIHPNRANVPKQELREALAKLYKVADSTTIILHGFKTRFGGLHSTGFGFIYDNATSMKKFCQKYLMKRMGVPVEEKKKLGRRAKKDVRHRKAKVRGIAKAKVSAGK